MVKHGVHFRLDPKCPEIKVWVYDKEARDCKEEIKQPRHAIVDGHLAIMDSNVIDYYGEFRGGFPYIDPQLEEWAEKRGQYFEWTNPEVVTLYNI
jgi:hypothetical protein